jgi:hypothetical protein
MNKVTALMKFAKAVETKSPSSSTSKKQNFNSTYNRRILLSLRTIKIIILKKEYSKIRRKNIRLKRESKNNQNRSSLKAESSFLKRLKNTFKHIIIKNRQM